MNNLRAAVKKLEEDELFEQTAVKGAELAMEDPTPSSNDIGMILQSLMRPPSASSDAPANPSPYNFLPPFQLTIRSRSTRGSPRGCVRSFRSADC